MQNEDVAMEIACLETILNYNMTPHEAKAFKVSCLFVDALRKEFPQERQYSYGKGDPRKKFLFKCCYKLVRELAHQIDDKDLPLYVQAQIDIIKVNASRSGISPNLTPNCLVGQRAWWRWKVWKKLYEKKLTEATTSEQANVFKYSHNEVCRRLLEDKKNLELRLGALNRETISKAVESRTILRWLAIGQISCYYGLLCPVLSAWLDERKLNLKDLVYHDLSIYQKSTTPEVIAFFKSNFVY